MDNLLFWNCRGAGNKHFPGLIRDYVKLYNLCFLAILEPRISGPKANRVIANLDFDGIFRVEAIGFTGGIWCLWKKNQINIDIISSSKLCVLLKVNPRSLHPWLLSVVYGSPRERHREDLWNELRTIHNDSDLLWCVARDFNSVLHPHEKVEGGAFNQGAGQRFAQCLFDSNLVDLGCKGLLFTWKSGSLKERHDRALGNITWQSLFPNSTVTNIPLLSSDYCDIWLEPKGDHQTHDKPYFNFFGPWLDHEDFHNQVQHS